MTVTAQALEAIAAVVGPAWVRADRASREAYAADGLPTVHGLPGGVVLPGTRDDVIRVLRILAHHGCQHQSSVDGVAANLIERPGTRPRM